MDPQVRAQHFQAEVRPDVSQGFLDLRVLPVPVEIDVEQVISELSLAGRDTIFYMFTSQAASGAVSECRMPGLSSGGRAMMLVRYRNRTLGPLSG